MTDLLFIDVETPNGHNDRISSIGLVRCDYRGVVLASDSFLVNPEEPFSDFNMRITGIRPCDVANSPSFPELWRSSLASFFDGANLIAHNATFDLAVLWKTLSAYEITVPDWNYCCTKELARRKHPEFPNYKLPTVCRYLGLEMGQHHQALDDADACRKVFTALVKENGGYWPAFEPYYLKSKQDTAHQAHFSINKEPLKPSDYQTFLDLCGSIIANSEVSALEAMTALAYIEQHDTLKNDPSIGEVTSLMLTSLADGDIGAEESSQLVDLLKKIINPCDRSRELPHIEIAGNTFCLTGSFDHGPRDEIERAIGESGGTVLKGVSKKCDYVIVGGQGSEAWTTKNYGTKVKKALDLQAKGDDIIIAREADLPFWSN